MFNPQPLLDSADIFYLKDQFNVMFVLCLAGALASNSLLHMLLHQFKNKKIESLSYRTKTLKLSNPLTL